MNTINMNTALIAPCGMNCGICLGYLREKNKCPGCNAESANKPVSCVKCRIRNCEIIKELKSKLCYECGKFPCLRLRQLDKRYQTKYAMSMIENLINIKNLGIDEFVRNEEIRWTCNKCGGTVCVHRGYCLKCNKNKHETLTKNL